MFSKNVSFSFDMPVTDAHSPTHNQTRGQICRTMREAVYRAAHGQDSLKALAADLDLAPSTLSACTVLGDGEHVRPFPAERLADLCRLTGDISPLMTLADMLGFAVLERDAVADMASDLEITARKLRVIRGDRQL